MGWNDAPRVPRLGAMPRPCFKLEKVHPDPVAGVDEAGCAPLAGPVVAAAVILDREKFPRGIGVDPAMVLVDGNRCPRWERPSVAIVRGDAKCRSIAAASIVAKVTRDRIMTEHAREWPGYCGERNVGYPTPEHQRALRELGPTPLHRRSFAPVRQLSLEL